MLIAAAVDLGLDPETLPRALYRPRTEAIVPPHTQIEIPLEVTDEEWGVLAAFLPPEPPQSKTLGNRDVLNGVLWVIVRGKQWTNLGTAPEAIRRRFGRWAHAGIWLALYEGAARAQVSPDRQVQLRKVADRAERLRTKGSRSYRRSG